jgi:hypothetical protein
MAATKTARLDLLLATIDMYNRIRVISTECLSLDVRLILINDIFFE